MKTLKITLSIIAALLVVAAIVFSHFGGFRKITFQTADVGGDTLVYVSMKGDYAGTGDVIGHVRQTLEENFGVTAPRGFGLYFDNPRQVARENLRYDAGCIVSGVGSDTLASIAKKFEVRVSPVRPSLVTDFPYRGGPSILVGIMRVYPAMTAWFGQQGMMDRFGPVMEIYDIPARTIHYRVEILDTPETPAAPAGGVGSAAPVPSAAPTAPAASPASATPAAPDAPARK